MAEQNKDFVQFNGISKKLVHEIEKDGKKFFNVSIPVAHDVSRNGLATFAVSNEKLIRECKSDANKVNVSIPANWKLSVSVASFYNKDEKDKTKYATKEMDATALESAFIENRKAIKEAVAAKTAETPEVEADGPELD